MTDIWTEDYHKASFISDIIHYTDKNFEIVSRVLFAAPFESSVSKTGDNVKSLLFQKLRELGIDAWLLSSHVVFVTDRGANTVAALHGYTRLNCNAHILSVTLCTFSSGENYWAVWTDQWLMQNNWLNKHSGLQNSLKISLEQSIDIWWNSNYDMLDSILQQHEEISTLLLENNQYERMAQINANTLRTVVVFLKLFKDATNDLRVRQLHSKCITSTDVVCDTRWTLPSSNPCSLKLPMCVPHVWKTWWESVIHLRILSTKCTGLQRSCNAS